MKHNLEDWDATRGDVWCTDCGTIWNKSDVIQPTDDMCTGTTAAKVEKDIDDLLYSMSWSNDTSGGATQRAVKDLAEVVKRLARALDARGGGQP